MKYKIIKTELRRTISCAWASYVIHCNEHNEEMKAKRPTWSADAPYPRELNSVYSPQFLKIITIKGICVSPAGEHGKELPEVKVTFEGGDESSNSKYFSCGVLNYDSIMEEIEGQLKAYLEEYGDKYTISKVEVILTTYYSKKLNKTFKEIYSIDVEY